MILIADSGATKVAWRAIPNSGPVMEIETEGINAVLSDEKHIIAALDHIRKRTGAVDEIHFYGAGVLGEAEETLRRCFVEVFPEAKTETASDIVAAARALCGHEPGIACILGTGSNSCLYDGSGISGHVNAGGFILGDEGGGSDLGKKLISDFLKGILPETLSAELRLRFGLDYKSVVTKVYREPSPSRYLASFAPFIAEHRDHPYITELLHSRFTAFLDRNVMQYPGHENLPVSFSGSIAYYFRKELGEAVASRGLRKGKILRGPIDALTDYHRK